MISCEGYKMFRGTMRIVPINPKFPCQELFGDWLYKPKYDCWYHLGKSYPSDICEIIEDKTE